LSPSGYNGSFTRRYTSRALRKFLLLYTTNPSDRRSFFLLLLDMRPDLQKSTREPPLNQPNSAIEPTDFPNLPCPCPHFLKRPSSRRSLLQAKGINQRTSVQYFSVIHSLYRYCAPHQRQPVGRLYPAYLIRRRILSQPTHVPNTKRLSTPIMMRPTINMTVN